jgi:flagellar protein FliL
VARRVLDGLHEETSMADDKDTKPTPEGKPAGGGSKIVPILLGVNMLLVVGLLALFFLKGQGHAAEAKPSAEGDKSAEHGEAAPGEAGAPGTSAKLADFVVHLRDPEVDRYARISFEIELAGEADKAKLERFTARIRDGFIAYLSDRTLEELRGSEQVKKVKGALQELLKDLAPGVKIHALYITDLVIQ